MQFDPDTEIQYRRGGKIMKKTPKKFYGGGITEGPNANIDDDTRARALAAVKARMEAAPVSKPAKRVRPVRKAKPSATALDSSRSADGNEPGLPEPKMQGLADMLSENRKQGEPEMRGRSDMLSENRMKKGGKVAKYAKGGSVRGYGISKVTNKTKYC